MPPLPPYLAEKFDISREILIFPAFPGKREPKSSPLKVKPSNLLVCRDNYEKGNKP
jgi:hypothetical protein